MTPQIHLGLVAHPTRDIKRPLDDLLAWARDHDAEVTQIPYGDHLLLPEGEAESCTLVVAIGGDGTTLAAIHRAAEGGKPVLGIACGSLGALTAVEADAVRSALDRWDAGDWLPRPVPALRVRAAEHSDVIAFNDLAIMRRGAGQLRVAISVDGTLYTRLAGDGCIVSTPAGSSAYTIAAGGPLVSLELEAFVITPLPTHGGFSPPFVLASGSHLELEVTTGYGGGRLEVDGRALDGVPAHLSVAFEPGAATIVAFSDQESHLAGLRRRGILADSPRIIADDERSGRR